MFWQQIPRSFLLEPEAYRPSAWSEHVPFAFWLIETLRPARLVELGTWHGMSYLAFCQAIRKFETGTEAFAVDTWQGDAHTGPLADQALASLKRAHDPLYADFSTLLRMDFNDAVGRFEDGSIDLLHIDGLHTYEAVKHDFETWLPKLSRSAVVLFHDSQVREKDFGVYRLWAELTQLYPHFEFHHEHGLGVLGVGADRHPALESLFASARQQDEAAQVRGVFERLGRGVRATQDAAKMRDRWSALIAKFPVRAAIGLNGAVRRLLGRG